MKNKKLFALLTLAVLIIAGLFVFSACDTVTVEYKVNFYSKTTPTSEYVYRGNLVIVGGKINTVNAEGFLPRMSSYDLKFDGWFKDEACTIPFDTTATIPGTINLYAKWTEVLAKTPNGLIHDGKGELVWNSVENAKYELTFTGTGENAPESFIMDNVATNSFDMNTLLEQKTISQLIGSYNVSVKSIVGEEVSEQSDFINIVISQPTLTVEFYNGSKEVDTLTVEDGSVTIDDLTSVMLGVEFVGWFEDLQTGERVDLSQVGSLFGNTLFSSTIRLYAKWTGDVSLGEAGEVQYGANDNDIREVTADSTFNYIYYAGSTYNFGENVVVEENEYITKISDSVFTIKSNVPAGTIFDLNYTLNGQEMTRKAKVALFVNGVTYGLGYSTYNTNSGTNNTTFMVKNNPYAIGMSANSKFYLDLSFDITNVVSAEQTAVAMTFTTSIDGQPTNYVIVKPDAVEGKYYLDFDQAQIGALSGKTLVVTARPTYLNKTQNDTATDYTLTFSFTLNEGVNVYTHEQLKEAFSDASINQINIHATIQSALDENQMNYDGSAVNTTSGRQHNLDSGKVTANVYRRRTTSDTPLVINGNYFTIDASNVSKVFYRSNDSAFAGQAAPNGAFGGSQDDKMVQNIHIAIFNLVNSQTEEGGISAADVRAIFNNLEIKGNTDYKGNTEAEVAIYSGGHNGIMVNDASVECFNVNVHHTTIAYYFHSINNKNNYSSLTNCIADINWANSIYVHGSTALSVLDSRMLRCSGATIHFEDPVTTRNSTPQYLGATDGFRYDPAFIIDTATVIENWMTGNEAWFNAWGMTAAVVPLKIQVQNAAFGNFGGQSIINTSSGVEKLNFAFMHKTCNDYSQCEIMILDGQDNSIVKNAYTLVSSSVGENDTNTTSELHYGLDLRNQGGSTLVPVGDATDTAWMAQIVAYATHQGAVATIIASSGGYIQTPEAAIQYGIANNVAEIVNYVNLVDIYGDKLSDSVKGDINALLATHGANLVNYIGAYVYAGNSFDFTTGNIAEAYQFGNGKKFLSLTLSGANFQSGSDGFKSVASVWLQFGSGEGWLGEALVSDD